jgi:hypothetical protein|tara:strand:- start:569 stop:730 length:162 start_codon:yes stop_codon:yes gene_type:complete
MVLYITKKVPLQELIAYWRFKKLEKGGPSAEGPSRGSDIGYALGYSLVRKQDL